MNLLQKKVNMHEDLCVELNKLYEKKNSDYDDAFAKSFSKYGMSAPCIRLEDKLNRLFALTVASKSSMVAEESIEDTLKDLANYAIMTLIELRLQKETEANECGCGHTTCAECTNGCLAGKFNVVADAVQSTLETSDNKTLWKK